MYITFVLACDIIRAILVVNIQDNYLLKEYSRENPQSVKLPLIGQPQALFKEIW